MDGHVERTQWSRLSFCTTALVDSGIMLLLNLPVSVAQALSETDLLIYGATAAEISAAVAAATEGHDVLSIGPANRIGGLVTRGCLILTFIHAKAFRGHLWLLPNACKSTRKDVWPGFKTSKRL